MTHRITIDGRGRTFEALPGQSLLAAALGAGVPAPYGCANGNCGECRAVLVDGAVERVAHSDFPLARAERRDGVLLLCCNAPVSDCTVRLSGDEPIEVQSLTVRVQRAESVGEGITALQLRTPRSQLLRYLSGQRVRLALRSGEARELPLASCPCEGDRLTVHLSGDDTDPFTRAAGVLQRGDRLALEGPFGDFTLPAAPARAQVFISAGTGHAAVHGLLSQLVNLEADVPVSVLRIVPPGAEPSLHAYCRSLVDVFDPYRYEVLEPRTDRVALAADLATRIRGWHGAEADAWLSVEHDEAPLREALRAAGLDLPLRRCASFA